MDVVLVCVHVCCRRHSHSFLTLVLSLPKLIVLAIRAAVSLMCGVMMKLVYLKFENKGKKA